jgi:ABC-type glutathione transport system ATPase component
MNGAAPEPVLRFEGVTKDFKVSGTFLQALTRRETEIVRAVDDVTCEVAAGEILGVIGQSGSGKTTLGFLGVKLLSPTSGRILLEGNDIARLKGIKLRKSRSRFQIVFQNPYQSLNPRMTVRRLLDEPLRIHHPALTRAEREERILDTLDRVGLAPVHDFAARYPRQMSGGQRQRAAVGRSIITGPSLLVADEPVSMLDVSVQAGILRLLRELTRDLGMAQLFITHDLAVAKHVCDRVVVMKEGRIVESGPAKQVLTNPDHPYTQLLMVSLPTLPRAR